MANANELVPILNPLLNNEIVDKLFEYLPLNDIIIQRGVCRLWNRIGLERLKKDIDQIQISFIRANFIEDFFEMANGSSLNFTNFEVMYCSSNDYWNEQTNRLFNEYGTHMKLLSLCLWDWTNGWPFLLDVLVSKAPNVEGLCFEFLQRWSETPRLFQGKEKSELKLKDLQLTILKVNQLTHYQTILADIFAISPNLESFGLGVLSDEEHIIKLCNYFHQMLAEKRNISKLKTISLNVGEHHSSEVLTTTFKSARLETVFLNISGMDLSMVAYIETFFGDHKDTLKKLNIFLPCVALLKKVTLPTIKNLETLLITSRCENGSEHEHRCPFGVFDFGKVFPNLRTLRVCELGHFPKKRFFNLDEMFPEDSTPVLTLKNLDLPPISNVDVLRRLGRIFPNVLKLILRSQAPAVLRELWTTWPEIKTLRIELLSNPSYSSINLDSVFTGVDGGDHSKNFTSISNLRSCVLASTIAYMILCDLLFAELKHLSICGSPYRCDSSNVTDIRIKDVTARLALAEMKELVSLEISWECHEISSSCVQYLCAELDMMVTETWAEGNTLHLVKYEWQKLLYCPTLSITDEENSI